VEDGRISGCKNGGRELHRKVTHVISVGEYHFPQENSCTVLSDVTRRVAVSGSVCLCVCLSVCLSVTYHEPIFLRMFTVVVALYFTSGTSGFVDDVMFSCNGPNDSVSLPQ